MEKSIRKNIIKLVILVVVIAFSAIMANLIERDFGNVEISLIKLMNSQGEIVVAAVLGVSGNEDFSVA